ncbi:MAG: ABC transporter ATP-binding protein [Fimbriimonadaceae bacterium]|nr:ABC transporter ATP-binding protein [Fimbriimonadaceae bacterium]QYK58776.1 MAG: ABC transporter ATP-binding protein [Fimbriimonadaceae bacterium]
MGLAIETRNLVKKYKTRKGSSITVVDNVDLQVEPGEIFGFLGPNGAGKTTTIKILLGIIYQTSGDAFILGKEAGDIAVHRELSYLPEKPYYYEHMTGLEVMQFYASLFGMKDIAKCKSLLERVNLGNDMNRPISQYSKGMQQRVGLAQSLLNDPKLLFLDEPTGGLDPIAHIEIRDLILQFREEGKTVFISSHELSDVERICDRVAIINKGAVVAQGRLEELLVGGRIEVTANNCTTELADSLRDSHNLVSINHGRMIVDIPDSKNPNDLVGAIAKAGGEIVSVIPRRKRLEDFFLEAVSGDNIAKGRHQPSMLEATETEETDS